MTSVRPISLAIAALGGQGGGVVSDWLVDVARRSDFLAQATSVPGVAQRTGATIYYLEFFPRAALPADGRRPIFALMPNPGDVDVVIASEAIEAGRVLERGLVTQRTTFIASSHRVYTIVEKSHLSDGRSDPIPIVALARSRSKRFIELDLQAVAYSQGSVISAAMLGALCGSAALPFLSQFYLDAIRAGGIAVDSSIRAFESARELVLASCADSPPNARIDRVDVLPAPLAHQLSRIPSRVQGIAHSGVNRLLDYQDLAYAELYLERLEAIIKADSDVSGDYLLAQTVARGLALWMSFEDTIRVADLKIRASRTQRVLQDARVSAGEIAQVTEFMKPRIEEICGTMPASLGKWFLNSRVRKRWISYVAGDRKIPTSTISGFLQLYCLASLRGFRHKTLRYQQEQARICEWLTVLRNLIPLHYALAVEVASCQELLKGYGDTHERGASRFDAILVKARTWALDEQAAAWVRALRKAALADEQGKEFAGTLAALPDGTGNLSASSAGTLH